jgi:hypothetical protein
MLGSPLISCNTVSIDSQKGGTEVWQHCAFKIPNQTFIQIYRMKSVRLSWPSIVFLKLEHIIGIGTQISREIRQHVMFILIGPHVRHFGNGNQTMCPTLKK